MLGAQKSDRLIRGTRLGQVGGRPVIDGHEALADFTPIAGIRRSGALSRRELLGELTLVRRERPPDFAPRSRHAKTRGRRERRARPGDAAIRESQTESALTGDRRHDPHVGARGEELPTRNRDSRA